MLEDVEVSRSFMKRMKSTGEIIEMQLKLYLLHQR